MSQSRSRARPRRLSPAAGQRAGTGAGCHNDDNDPAGCVGAALAAIALAEHPREPAAGLPPPAGHRLPQRQQLCSAGGLPALAEGRYRHESSHCACQSWHASRQALPGRLRARQGRNSSASRRCASVLTRMRVLCHASIFGTVRNVGCNRAAAGAADARRALAPGLRDSRRRAAAANTGRTTRESPRDGLFVAAVCRPAPCVHDLGTSAGADECDPGVPPWPVSEPSGVGGRQ